MRTFKLGVLSHSDGPEGGIGCVNEIASQLVGEAWGDNPSCVSPIIRECAIMYNDSFDTDEELRASRFANLLPWRLVGTNDPALTDIRFAMLLGFLIKLSKSECYPGAMDTDLLRFHNLQLGPINEWDDELKHAIQIGLPMPQDGRERKRLANLINRLIALSEIKEPACEGADCLQLVR